MIFVDQFEREFLFKKGVQLREPSKDVRSSSLVTKINKKMSLDCNVK